MIWPGHARFVRMVQLHFEGGLSPRQERAMRQHLPGCAGCRALYLSLVVTEGDGAAAAERRRERLRVGLFGHDENQLAARRFGWRPLALAAACFAALLAAVILSQQAAPPGTPGGWQQKGPDVDRGSALSRHVNISVFRPRPGGGFEPIANRRISSGRPLAFTYTNQAPEGLDRLLLFGVDERDEVYWFYPAWTDPAKTPGAAPVQRGTRLRLPEQVTHEYQGKRLRIFALFSKRRDLTVRSVESAVKRLSSSGVATIEVERFPLKETGQHSLLFEIVDSP